MDMKNMSTVLKGLANSINNIASKDINEEQTKHSLVLPFFMALGYNIFDMTEFIPEYTADFGIKQGEKVDYAIVMNGQPIAVIEVKKIGKQLSQDNISQLFRYYSTTDARFAILTNGNDYWFFTDSKKTNKMDTDPYLKIRLTDLTENDTVELCKYSRDNIQRIDISNSIAEIRLRNKSVEIISDIVNGEIPTSFIDWISEVCEVSDLDRAKSAELINEAVQQVLHSVNSASNKCKPHGDTGVSRIKEEEKSNISLEKEYVFNDYTDGDWRLHSPEYIILDGARIDVKSFSEILVLAIKWLLDSGNITVQSLSEVKALHWGSDTEKIRAPKEITGYNRYVTTAFGCGQLIALIEKLFKAANVENSMIKIKFRK